MDNKCPICGAPMKEGKCSYCGYEAAEMPFDREKGTESSRASDVVQNGRTVAENSPPEEEGFTPGVSRKSKTVALLLCIFLGGLGIHRYYVGKIGTGILYMCTAGFGGIGWVIDIILIATGKFKDEFDLPLKQ